MVRWWVVVVMGGGGDGQFPKIICSSSFTQGALGVGDTAPLVLHKGSRVLETNLSNDTFSGNQCSTTLCLMMKSLYVEAL